MGRHMKSLFASPSSSDCSFLVERSRSSAIACTKRVPSKSHVVTPRCCFVRWWHVVKSDKRIKESFHTECYILITFSNITSRFQAHCPASVGRCAACVSLESLGTGVVYLRFVLGPKDWQNSYLVDPASSHMLVSKIKPCMSKYKSFIRWNCERLIISAIIYLMVPYYMDNCGNSRANTCVKSRLSRGGMYLLDKKPIRFWRFCGES